VRRGGIPKNQEKNTHFFRNTVVEYGESVQGKRDDSSEVRCENCYRLIALMRRSLPGARVQNRDRQASGVGDVDLTTHKLTCIVEKGTMVDGEFVPSSGLKYEVSPDDALMAFGGEQRSFGEEEAANLHLLLDVLSRYCVDSVVWWDHGNARPTSPAPGPATKPERPAQPTPTSAPAKPIKVAQQKPQQSSTVKTTDLAAAKGQ
jgi:hypothetical protein